MADNGNGARAAIDAERETIENETLEQMTQRTALEGKPLVGTEDQLTFDLGSEYNLADSTLKVGTVPLLTVKGQYQEGDRIQIMLEVEVEHLSFPPIKDRGMRVGTERRHIGFVLSAAPVVKRKRAAAK